MHESVMRWFQAALDRSEVEGKDIAEVGAMDINGSVYDYISMFYPDTYLGVDIRPGRRVNMILDAADLPSAGSFDLVISTECLDHCEDWKAAMTGMVTALKPDGILMLTTRSEGFPYHPHPGDYWRFSIEDVTLIAGRSGLEVVDIVTDPQDQLPGVFLKARKPPGWKASKINLKDVTVPEVVKG
jgi:SAM-dependent methyltransferase